MRFLIILGFLLGFGGVLTAAALVPWGAQERIRSQATVARNGGRHETFVIRLPADRIASAGAGVTGPLTGDPVARVTPPPALADTRFAVEQFKLRNERGDVIGVAMRHWTHAEGVGASTWVANIPGRGALVWTSQGELPSELASALSAAGARPGIEWHGELSFVAGANERNGVVVTGTEDFAESSGVVEEIWAISGVGGDGELRGTITLDTTVNQSS